MEPLPSPEFGTVPILPLRQIAAILKIHPQMVGLRRTPPLPSYPCQVRPVAQPVRAGLL